MTSLCVDLGVTFAPGTAGHTAYLMTPSLAESVKGLNYIEYQSSELGPQTPSPPPFEPEGREETHSLDGDWVGDPIQTTGLKLWYSI